MEMKYVALWLRGVHNQIGVCVCEMKRTSFNFLCKPIQTLYIQMARYWFAFGRQSAELDGSTHRYTSNFSCLWHTEPNKCVTWINFREESSKGWYTAWVCCHYTSAMKMSHVTIKIITFALLWRCVAALSVCVCDATSRAYCSVASVRNSS